MPTERYPRQTRWTGVPADGEDGIHFTEQNNLALGEALRDPVLRLV
ncbi:hypothetical protein [Mycolicibacterium vaccae]|uniref:Uncharacterized protein n=1 Tax=Mycolicibacterium vaccae ATCC 25954 TaxID=1194972 RepID=K0UW07_MYCVA|nr:hypothetical protein [Mycolicibacterium vaccae]EJZ09265.1 hypothetical protein MVAC_12818 [Mycolicibacterium vaccae ATCC 25954]